MCEMNFNFDYNFVKSGAPVVTINSSGIAFNYLSRSLLGFPERINIGYDEITNAIGVKCHDDNSNIPYYEFEKKAKNDWVRIGCKDFIRYLCNKANIDFAIKSQQFIVDYDEIKKILIVIVDAKHMKSNKQ